MDTPGEPRARQSVDVGGARLEAVLAGGGPVTVVFENGLGTSLEAWDAVVAPIAERARVVRCNRRLAAPSGVVPARTAADMAADLRRLLDALAVPPPYVLVGHSWGGVVTRVFARAHPGEVAGLVFVDAIGSRSRPDGRRRQRLQRQVGAARARCVEGYRRSCGERAIHEHPDQRTPDAVRRAGRRDCRRRRCARRRRAAGRRRIACSAPRYRVARRRPWSIRSLQVEARHRGL